MNTPQPDTSPHPALLPPGGGTVVFIDAAYLLTALAAHHGATMSTAIFDSRGIAAKVGDLVAARLGAVHSPDSIPLEAAPLEAPPLEAAPLEADRVELRWYDAVDPTKRVEAPWVAALRNHPGIRLRLGRTTVRDDNRLEQKRVDTLLVADVVEAVYSPAPPSDVVIVSGDEDMTPAVDVAVARAARVHLVTLTVDGSRIGVSHHLRLSVTSELAVDIGELAPLATSRSRMFAQMAGLQPNKPAATAVDTADSADPAGDASVTDEQTREVEEQPSWRQPVLPGMPPDPPRWAEEVDAPPSVSQCDLLVAEQATLEERVQAGQVSRAYLAGRPYACRWLGADPAVRAAEVAVILARHPYLPNSVDSALMRFAAHHVGLGPGGRQNRVDVRAGFSAAVRRLAGVTGPDGVDTLAPDGRMRGDVAARVPVAPAA